MSTARPSMIMKLPKPPLAAAMIRIRTSPAPPSQVMAVGRHLGRAGDVAGVWDVSGKDEQLPGSGRCELRAECRARPSPGRGTILDSRATVAPMRMLLTSEGVRDDVIRQTLVEL